MRKVEPVILLLSCLLVFFTLMLFAAEKFFNSDGQMFQVMSGLLTGISGALLMGIKNQLGIPDAAPPGTVSRVTDQHTVQVEPKEQ